MAKSEGQKLKLIHLMDIFREYTDEDHSLSMSEIITKLNERDITAERKSIYNDIALLDDYGFEIEMSEGKIPRYCHIPDDSKDFSLAELKLLADSIQSSKFITERKTRDLIKKIKGLCSQHEAKQLQRQVVIARRIKSMNETVLYNVDALQRAIAENKQVSFKYFDYSVKKEQVLRRNGERYIECPFNLIYTDDNYYLLAYEEAAGKFKHFRVDKMREVRLLDKPCLGREAYEELDMATYTQYTFSMFGGEPQKVSMQFHNSLMGVVIDRFGKDVMVIPVDDEHFKITVPVAVSEQFFGWVFGLGHKAMLVEPQKVVDRFTELVAGIGAKYQK